MDGWELALNKFLEHWKTSEDVLGAIVAGSYASGDQNEHSDIDVHIVLSDNVNWRERGNKIIDGFLIEYFANPPRQLKKYLEEDYKSNSRIDARMFSTGRIIFDKDGTVMRLQTEARVQMKRQFEKMSVIETEMAKYALWDQLDNLHELRDKQSPNIQYAYYTALSKLLATYALYLQAEIIAPSKVYKYFTDGSFRNRYPLDQFPDTDFSRQATVCLENANFKNIQSLTEYVLEKMGGFSIDGWKMKSPVG